MEKLETPKKVTELEAEIKTKEVGELEAREQELLEQLKKVRDRISLEKSRAAIKKGEEKFAEEETETKAAMQRGKFKMLQEEWADKEKTRRADKEIKEGEQKAQAKEILKKFFEREEEKKKEILIDEAEQEKLIEEALRDREAERLLQESPARADLEMAMRRTREEFKKPKELEIGEVKYFEEGELPEKVETYALTEAKRYEASAKRTSELAKKLEKEIKEKGIDVNKMELSFTERMKFSIKKIFDKKLRHDYRSFELARLAEDEDRATAFELKLAATKPADYIKFAAEKAMEKIAKRRIEKMIGSKQTSVSPLGWVKRV